MESVGQRVKHLRQARGLSQVQLARACGVDQSTISDIERDINTSFSGKVLLGMADSLHASPYFLISGGKNDVDALDEAELIRAFRKVDPEARSILLRTASALAAQAAGASEPNDSQ